MTQTLTILHLSDLHIVSKASGGKRVLQQQVFNAFWEYVSHWKSSPGADPPDVIVVSGDLAKSGKQIEYGPPPGRRRAGPFGTVLDFLRRLCDEFELPESRVFLTPGNHDVDRELVDTTYAKAQLELIENEERLVEFFYDQGKVGVRNDIFRRLRAYYELHCRFMRNRARDTSDAILNLFYKPKCCGHSDGLPFNVAAVSLCTPWLSQSYYHAYPGDATVSKMGAEPPGWLAVCQPKIEEAVKDSAFRDPGTLRIAVMHHPPSWLVGWERSSVEKCLGQAFDLVFTGHVHEDDVFVPQLGHRAHTISAGAFYLGKGYVNSFNIVRVRGENGIPRFADLRVVRWDKKQTVWHNSELPVSIDERHRALGYANADGWLTLPLGSDHQTISGARISVRIYLPNKQKSDLSDADLNRIREILNMWSREDVELKVIHEQSIVLEFEVPSGSVHRIHDALASTEQGWCHLLSQYGISEIKVGSRRYVTRPHTEYVSTGTIDRRRPRLSRTDLSRDFDVGPGVLWEEVGAALAQMFIVRCIDDLLLAGTTPESRDPDRIPQENLTPRASDDSEVEDRTSEDWGWYCPTRLSGEGPRGMMPEAQMYQSLNGPVTDGTKKVVLVHGGTGHGKTTFLRHFFRKHLPEIDPELAARTIAVRISLGIAGMTLASLEDDVDNKINTYLDKHFPELYSDECMLSMAEQARKLDTDFHARLLAEHPMGKSRADKLQWINSIVGRKSVLKECNNVFADFNRLRIQYLTKRLHKKFVIVLDNIDQMPRQIQEAAFMLARHKLEWVQNTNDVSVVIALRSYLLTRAAKELPLSAYQNRYEVCIRPPRLMDVLQRRTRYAEREFPKQLTFHQAGLFRRRSTPVSATKTTLTKMLGQWVTAFGDMETDLALSKMSNHDLREQLRMVSTIFRSPNFDWLRLVDAVATPSVRHISHDRILDMLLRGTNLLCSTDSPVFFANLFNAGNHQHFANSLNQIYLLNVVKRLGSDYVDNVVSILADLGHPPAWTLESIEELLQRNVLLSPEGQYLRADQIRQICFQIEDEPLSEFYTETLPYRLYYMQAMAYQTPMQDKWRRLTPLPKRVGEDVQHFPVRLRAAAALVGQIMDDERRQREALEGNTRSLELHKQYCLGGIGERMCKEALKQLKRIRDSKIYESLDWGHVLETFEKLLP